MAPHPSIRGGTTLQGATAKLKRARDNKEQFTQKEQGIDRELQQLQERMYWLRTLRKLNRGQYRDWLSSVNDRSIVPFSKTWNLRFAEEMHARLPIELRNLVYLYLWDKDTITAYPDVALVAGGAKCLDDRCDCDRPHNVPVLLPHFIKPEYMGHSTIQGIVRALYEAFHSRDEPLTVRGPEHLDAALSGDVFRVGLNAALHIRSLVLRIKLDRLRMPCPQKTSAAAYKGTRNEKRYTTGTLFRWWLDALLCIKHIAKFELRVLLLQRNIRVAVIEEVLEDLAAVRETLHSQGADVKIDWIYRGTWHHGNNLDPDNVLCRNMDGFFELPRKAWNISMMRFLVQADIEGEIMEQHVRFLNEPCQHIPDRIFVQAMWNDSEDEGTTDGEEEDHIFDDISDNDGDEEEDDDCSGEVMTTPNTLEKYMHKVVDDKLEAGDDLNTNP